MEHRTLQEEDLESDDGEAQNPPAHDGIDHKHAPVHRLVGDGSLDEPQEDMLFRQHAHTGAVTELTRTRPSTRQEVVR